MVTLYRIHLNLEPNPDGVFTVTSPDVPGLVTEGATATEIQANVQEAIEALMEAWTTLGKPIPLALHPIANDRTQTVEMLVAA
jgi:antitoxin HicB